MQMRCVAAVQPIKQLLLPQSACIQLPVKPPLHLRVAERAIVPRKQPDLAVAEARPAAAHCIHVGRHVGPRVLIAVVHLQACKCAGERQ